MYLSCSTTSPVTEIWGLLALRLADDPVLPFDYQVYASQLQVH
jgi:N-acetylated-alpha-linked acidic dipeptidase